MSVSNQLLIAAAATLTIAILAFDLWLELGVAAGVPYIAVVCLFYLGPSRRWIWTAAVVGALLTLFGYYVSPSGGEFWKVLLNRLLSVSAIGVTAIFVDLAKRQQILLSSNEIDLQRLVTERTNQLALSEERMRLTFEASPTGLIVADEFGKFIMTNTQITEMFGYTQEEMLGKPVEMLLPSDLQKQHVGHRTEFMEEPQARQMATELELFGKHKDGQLIPVDVGLNPVQFGSQTCVLAAVSDITDRKKAENLINTANETLQRSNQELEQIAYVASHDLQEPLRKMSSFGHLLLEECGKELTGDGREYLGIIIDGAARLKALVTDLLSFSRINSHGKELNSTSAKECFDAAIYNLELLLTESKAEVSCDSLPAVIADASQLTMLFQNLIGNAIKYCEKNPRVYIGGRDVGEDFEFCVRDNGIGIEPQYFERIFEIFKRLHSRQEYSGTGIGLANCKRIVERFGGKLWLKSTPNEGSEFYFTIRKDTVCQQTPTLQDQSTSS